MTERMRELLRLIRRAESVGALRRGRRRWHAIRTHDRPPESKAEARLLLSTLKKPKK